MGFMTGLGGFSEGFGKAFSNSFDTSRQLAFREREKKEDRENDVFMQTMKDNAKYMEDLAEAERKDKAIVAKAKTIAQTHGLDAKITAEIAQRGRDSGGDFSEIIKLVEGGKFNSSAVNNLTTNPTINQTRANAPTNQLPGLDENSAALQTDSAMGINVEDGVATRPQAQAPSGIDFADGITYTPNAPEVDWNQRQNAARAKLEDALARGDQNAEVAARAELNRMRTANETLNPPNATGRTQFDVQNELSKAISSGNQEEAMRLQGVLTQVTTAEVNAKKIAAGPQAVIAVNPDGSKKVVMGTPQQNGDGGVEFVDASGQAIAGGRTQTEDERKEVQDIRAKVAGPERDKQVTRIADAGSALSSASKLVTMVDEDKNVLLDATGGMASFIDNGIHEIKGVGDLLGVEIQQNTQTGEIDGMSMQALEDRVNQLKTQPISDLAQRQALFKAELSILAYRAGAAEGQTGQAFTEKDFSRIENALKGRTSDPTTFKSALANYMNGVISRIDGQSKLMGENPLVRSFESQYGYSPIEQIVPSMDRYVNELQGDPNAQQGLAFVRENAGKNAIGSTQEQPKTNSGKTSNGISWSIE